MAEDEPQRSLSPPPRTRNPFLQSLLFAKADISSDHKDSTIIPTIKSQFDDENVGKILASRVLGQIGVDRFRDIVLGPKHVAFLLDDDSVVRIPYDIGCTSSEDKQIPEEEPHISVIPPLQPGKPSGAKYRRVMLGNRTYCRIRTSGSGDPRSVIIGGRPPVAASNVPEELINNVQQVLQGKSREVIVRELQRTGLNVNEAVNNLLSRDDGDDGLDAAADPSIPEELLQLLEQSNTLSNAATVALTSASGGDEAYVDLAFGREYRSGNVIGSAVSKKGKEKEKDKSKKKEENRDKMSIILGDKDEWWCGEHGAGMPPEVREQVLSRPINKNIKVKLAATSWALYVLHRNGKVYRWLWNEEIGENSPIELVKDSANKKHDLKKIGEDSDPVVLISASNLRLTIVSQSGFLLSWLDDLGVGKRVASASECFGQIPYESVIHIHEMTTSDFLTAVRSHNTVYWCGLHPLSDRHRYFEKEKEKKKHVSFNENAITPATSASTSSEIVVGSLVQPKKSPMYPKGSVAVYIDTCKPMIGVLLEDSWAGTENCRFRVISIEEYDREILKTPQVDAEIGSVVKQEQIEEDYPAERETRKRKAEDPVAVESGNQPPLYEYWNMEDVIWIHEHRKRDVMTVTLADSNMIAVKYNNAQNDSPYVSVHSDNQSIDVKPVISDETQRILRKEDVQLFTKKSESRAPKSLQKELCRFSFDATKIIYSISADLNGFRVLVKSKSDRCWFIYRVLVNGKTISRRKLPIHGGKIEELILENNELPRLINFGDNRTMFIRDPTGQLIPLTRDGLNGYCEPIPLNAQPNRLIATYSRPISTIPAGNEKGVSYEGSIIILTGVNIQRKYHSKFIKSGSSLMQLILHCDYDGVLSFLDKMIERRQNGRITHHEFRRIMHEQMYAIISDTCSNILHAAIRMCIPVSNSLDFDKVQLDPKPFTPFQRRNDPQMLVREPVPMEVDETQQQEGSSRGASPEDGENTEESKWKGRLRGRNRHSNESSNSRKGKRHSGESTKSSASDDKDGDDRAGSEESRDSDETVALRDADSDMPFGRVERDLETRQRNALKIVDLLLNHPAMFYEREASESVGFLEETDRCQSMKYLLFSRDLKGRTPYMLAVDSRCYGAAYYVWRALLRLGFAEMDANTKLKYIFPSLLTDTNFNADDSPLFIICYNDVCSFTWTGEDHINQDIYECKTCGLTGSLCCCSECALTCHRNHECKLKKTSPTAYCDCREKCACQASIIGNEKLREYLFCQLLQHTRLHELDNSRNEHIILFLSRTVIRQMKEQNGPMSKKRNNKTPSDGITPPKFARYALEQCCRKTEIVLSALKVGWHNFEMQTTVNRDYLHFVTQHSAAHLDKLTFTLMHKRLKDYSSMFVTTIRQELAKQGSARDDYIEEATTRFVRSLVRVITLGISIHPAGAAVIMGGEEAAESVINQNSSGSLDKERSYRFFSTSGFGFGGFTAAVLKKDSSKHPHDKTAGLVLMMSRAISILRTLGMFAVFELGAAADAIFAPIRYGVVRPMINPAVAGNQDPLDVLDKFFASDMAFVEILKKWTKDKIMKQSKKAKKHTRRDTDRNDSERQESVEDETMDDNNSDSQEGIGRHRGDSTSGSTTRGRRRRMSSTATGGEQNAIEEAPAENRQDFEVDVEESGDEEDDVEEVDDEDDGDDDDDDDEGDSEVNGQPVVRFINSDGEEDDDRNAGESDHDSNHDDDDQDSSSNSNAVPDNNSAAGGGAAGGDAPPVANDAGNSANSNDIVVVNAERRRLLDDSDDDFLNRQHNVASRFSHGNQEQADNNAPNQPNSGAAQPNAPSDRSRDYALYRRGNWAMRGAAGTLQRYMQYTFGSRSPPRHSHQNNRDDEAPAAAAASNNSASNANAEPSGTQSSSQPSTSNKRHGGGGGGDSHSSTTETKASIPWARQQLSMAFTLLVRLGCDILSKMQTPADTVYGASANPSNGLREKCHEMFNNLLKESFDWMIMFMDQTEAKIRFNAAYLDKVEHTVSMNEDKTTRKEVLQYMLNLMRSNADESKDQLAQIDMEMILPCAFAFEAYLVFVDCMTAKKIELKQLIDQYDDSWRRKYKDVCENIDEDIITGFFMRPISLSYPGDLYDGAWDTINGRDGEGMLRIQQDIPLVERNDLLTMEATPQSMFRYNDHAEERQIGDHVINPMELIVHHNANCYFPDGASLMNMTMQIPRKQTHHLNIMKQIREHYTQRKETDDEMYKNWSAIRRVDWRRTGNYTMKMRQHTTAVGILRHRILESSCTKPKILFAKWQKTIEMIGEQHYETLTESLGMEVAFENSLLLRKIARFGVKHQLFIRAAEKYRTMHSQTKEVMMEVHREQSTLIRDTIIYLNQLFNKKIAASRQNEPTACPLAGTRLRVRFIEEPGEGTGVTRSYFTAFAEACTQLKTTPFDRNEMKNDRIEELALSLNYPHPGYQQNRYMELMHRNRKIRREKSQRLKRNVQHLKTYPLNLSAPRFDLKNVYADGDWTKSVIKDPSYSEQAIKIFEENEPKMRNLHNGVAKFVKTPKVIGRVMGILCQLPPSVFKSTDNDDTLRLHVQQVCLELRADGEFDDTPEPLQLSDVQNTAPTTQAGMNPISLLKQSDQHAIDDICGNDALNEPLFETTPNGYNYVPRIGSGSPLRISAFRNIGRVIGICLSQGDIFPMKLARHVVAFILRQPVTWLDFGFFDAQVFNSLRSIMCSDQNDPETFAFQTFSMSETTVVDGVECLESINLKPNGDSILVDKDNVVEYIYRYVDRILLGPNLPALEALREGILDVIPETMMNGLTPEDFQLIMCGTDQICIETLQANTTFLDESRANSETLTRFKQWFWQVVESLTKQEKQDLIFFWTGTPALPPSGEWQTTATVMLRPSEDMFLPTANTCISRLYVPVYSSKRILKSKLLTAIKAKNFGFV